MNPSLYSNYGVHENEFFQQRDENEMKRIFDSVGVAMDHETFQKLWQTARERHPNGEVSSFFFQNIVMCSF